jgi:hypothetical protein
MKKTTAVMVVMLCATLTFAQRVHEKKVPENIKSVFLKSYPAATAIKWDKEGENFEASFNLNKSANSVLMDAQGAIIETEVEIELSQLPKAVLEYVKTHYAGKQPKEVAKITDANGAVTYEVEIKGMDLIFDTTGKFIKEIKE